MNNLTLLGLGVAAAASLLAAYALLTGDTGLLGAAASAVMAGGVVAVASTAPAEPSQQALHYYTGMLAAGSTAVLEDLDLLDAKPCAVNKGGRILIAFTKAACTQGVDPGVGFHGGSPYYAIPVEPLGEAVPAGSPGGLADALRVILVEELGVCRSVRVEEAGGVVKVRMQGVAGGLREYAGYPVNPAVLILLAAVAGVTGTGAVVLVDGKEVPGGVEVSLRVEKPVEAG
ncbi:hypothetical protein [Desulfurococcus mucosus]|uniref:hypothetical protein n=1 Tax=Desulfurococcus mucosus TaxID=2275 RepID=UPI0006626D93|nr:hypothetical protein [Desulfurococcus mucosus]